mgnify:CR=1 FL=1
MTEILNKVFFPVENFNNEESISLLEKYMFTKDFIFLYDLSKIKEQNVEKKSVVIEEPTRAINNIFVEEKKEIIFDRKLCEKKIEKPHIRDRICPNKMDTLFWCVFIAVYGYDEYNTISNHFSNREMEERQKMMDFLKKKPSLIKNSNVKITKVAFQEMLTDLMINKKVTLSILILFCIYYNITIFVVIDDIYMEFSVNKIGRAHV